MSIQTFELVSEKCMLAHVNVRTEMHGDERHRAYDLKFTKDFPNAVLKKFHPELLDTFYAASKQTDIEADYKPNLRFGLMGAVAWDLEIPRTMLTIHDPDGNDLVLGDGKTNKFKFEMLDGGTVKMSFRCQFPELEEDDVAKMLRALNETVPISLSCTTAEEKPDNFEQAELITQEPMSDARKEAEAAFKGSTAPAIDEAAGLPTLEASAPPADNVVDIKDSAKPKKEKAAKAAPEQKPDDAPLAEKQAAAPRARRGSGKAVIAPE